MTRTLPPDTSAVRLRQGRWLLLVAATTLLCCSCRAITGRSAGPSPAPPTNLSWTQPPLQNAAESPQQVPADAPGSDYALSDDQRAGEPDYAVRQVAHQEPADAAQPPAAELPVAPPAGAPQPAVAPHPPIDAAQAYLSGVQAMWAQYPMPPVGLPRHPNLPAIGYNPAACGCLPPSMPAPSIRPPDEYICDGGDQKIKVTVAPNWNVYGLDLEDTVAHYDTIDGKTEVEASNCVCLYAPRFAAVRRVDTLGLYDTRLASAHARRRTTLGQEDETRIVTSVVQPVQPERHLNARGADTFRKDLRTTYVDNTHHLALARNRFKPYENFLIFRRGVLDNAEKPQLAQWIDAAQAWSEHDSVRVILEGHLAHEANNNSTSAEYVTYERPPGKPRLRIVKAASRKDARPGEIVEFTLRFDNVGDQLIGNVTIIDNLTTRLEYVPDSQTCSLKANFVAPDNEGESLTLRWEITDPVKVGEGGLIRFKCRVR